MGTIEFNKMRELTIKIWDLTNLTNIEKLFQDLIDDHCVIVFV